MKLNLSKVKFSNKDFKKRIKIPDYLDEKLAELIGIHIGDGCIYKCGPEKRTYEISYSSSVYETDYIKHIIRLEKNIHNLKKFRIKIRDNERNLTFNSLAIATFYINSLKLPVGAKSKNIDIPDYIKKSKNRDIIISCVRGIFDTDFTLTTRLGYYPVIRGVFASKKLVLSLKEIFDDIGVISNIRLDVEKFDKRYNKVYIQHQITINGFERVSYFIELVKPNNPKYKKKWKGYKRKYILYKKWAQRDSNSRPLVILALLAFILIYQK